MAHVIWKNLRDVEGRPEVFRGDGNGLITLCREIGQKIIEENEAKRDSEPHIIVIIHRKNPSERRLLDLVPVDNYRGIHTRAQKIDLAALRIEPLLIGGQWRIGSPDEKLALIQQQGEEQVAVAQEKQGMRRAALADALANGLTPGRIVRMPTQVEPK